MRAHRTTSGCYEFNFPQLETMVQVIACSEHITIRATRPTFCPQRQEYFIRQLAREGFIPDEYQWPSAHAASIRWLVDASWVSPAEVDEPDPSRRLWWAGLFCSAGAIWVLSMVLLFAHAH